MESATYYTGWPGPAILVQLTSDSPSAREIFADQEGAQPIYWDDVLSVPGKEITAGGYGNTIEIDLKNALDPVADQDITVQADITKWFYVKDFTGFLGALRVSAKCRFDTPSIPVVFAGQQ